MHTAQSIGIRGRCGFNCHNALSSYSLYCFDCIRPCFVRCMEFFLVIGRPFIMYVFIMSHDLRFNFNSLYALYNITIRVVLRSSPWAYNHIHRFAPSSFCLHVFSLNDQRLLFSIATTSIDIYALNELI